MNERDLFLSALEIEDSAARQAHLQLACADDAGLLIRVESLLASHEGESRFLQTPVVEQLGDEPARQTDATIVMGTGSTQGEEPSGDDSAASILEFSQRQEQVKMADEIPLGYLEPSTKPGSLGRLAHYEVLEVVGQGAFGTVLRAFDEKLQRVVAIKVMAPELAATSPARKRFVREAQASAQIRHEHVVSVYSVEEKPIPYLVMEYIPGVTLQQRLDEKGPLDVPTMLRLGTQIAEGLAAAHAKDLIHRDIKPGNVLLEAGMHDRVKITDFGLARAADDASMTQSGTIAGTPMYMAPEQALGKKLDQRADLFSFGSVLYQMVSGRPPFRASSTLAVLKRLTEDTPRPIREIIPETPTWLCDIITKLHAKNPDERYQSAREVADVLANCESQLKEHSRLKDLSLIPRAKTKPAGWWKWVAAAAVVLPLLAIGLYTFTRPGSEPKVAENGSVEPSIPDPIKPVATAKPSPATISVVPVTEDWVQLFNGKDLTGWTARTPRFWSVQGGELIGEIGDGKFRFLESDRNDYTGFHLRAEVNIVEGVGGIRFRQTPESGYMAQLNPADKSLWKTGSLAVRRNIDGREVWTWPAKKGTPRPTNTWFQYEIIASGTTLRLLVNGVETARITDATANRGRITLQLDRPGTVIKFRKIEIKELSPGSLPPSFTNSIGMEFVKVLKGKSWLGGGKDKLGDNPVEIPADFYLGKYEVTQEEWTQVMGENPCHFSRMGGGKDAVKDITDAELKRFPVENVSWENCQLFVAKLNKLEKETGWVYRLPKEAEWEYACRGGPMADKLDSAFDFYFAKPTNTLSSDQANVKESGKNRTCAVGSYQPNQLGLYDMHGNVWEWCQDEKDNEGASKRIYVGDGWESDSWNGKAAFRRTPIPPSARHTAVGLRLARVPSGGPSPDAKTPPLAAAVLKDAVLVMTFEKDTFYEKDGQTYVRDLSGNGNDGLCENVECTSGGKVGGGLACKGGRLRLNKSLINRQPNYTITLWGRADKVGANVPKEQLYLSAPFDRPGGGVFRIGLPPERTVHVGAWNGAKRPDSWGRANTKESVIPEREWYFLAVTLSGGGTEKGEIRVTVNGAVVDVVDFSMQMVDSDRHGLVDMLGHGMTDCVLDEVAIFQRALTDQEIAAMRALGLKGTPPATDRFALAFDGKNGRVKIPSLRITEAHPLTAEAWIVIEDREGRNQNFDLLGNAHELQGFSLGLRSGQGEAGGEKWAFAIRSTSPNAYVRTFEKQPVPQNQLIHLAGVYDGKEEIRLYVNGQLQSRTPIQNVNPSTLSMMRLGVDSVLTNYFRGRMNEVRISKVARYDGDFTPDQRWMPDTDTLALYHFGEGAGTVLKDSSGNGHHGEIVAAKWVQADGSPIGSPPNAVPSKPLPPTYTNSTGMEFVIVPKGKSWLGGGKDRLGDQEVEIPADFYLGKYEVTQEEWEKVMGENPSHFSRNGAGMDAVKDISDADLRRFPVASMSWDQCQLFVAKLNKLEKDKGWVYRLPKSAEWEYACRGGPMSVSDKLDSAFHFFFAKPTNILLPEQANYNSGTEQNPIGLNRTCKVGSYEPNGLGLFDMHGNVWEWCDDTVRKDDATSLGVYQGGSWLNSHLSCRAAARITNPRTDRGEFLGFRLARIPSGAPSPEATMPPLAADVLKDAVLLMDFEKETFYEKDGKTYVRDLSGNGNDGLCDNVEFTSDGKVGGGLACQGGRLQLPKSLINQQPNYTIAVWGRTKQLPASGKLGNLYITAASRDMLPVFEIEPTRDRGLYFTSWHRAKQPKNWVNFKTTTHQFTDEHWFFLAVTLSGGGVDKGDLRVTVNDLVTHGSIQMVEAPDEKTDFLGHAMTDCVLDEVAIFQRALTDQEIAAVRALGLQGTLLDGRKPAISVAAQQVKEVRKELMRLNPGFDGKLTPTIENEVVTELSVNTDQITNIAPMRALTKLVYLDCRGTYPNNGILSDLSPIKGMQLSRIDCSSTQIADLSPLADMPLTYLHFNHNPVSDLTPLKGMSLEELGLAETKVSDLSPLKGMKLRILGAQLIPVTDLSPLQGMPLTGLDLYGTTGVTSLEPLKGMPLEGLNIQDVPVSDLSPLVGMTTLRTLLLQGNKVSDLSPLAGLKLTDLLLHDKQIADLSPLKGLPLKRLTIDGTGVSDLRPLQGMELVELRLTPKNVTQGLEIIREMKSLKIIGSGSAANQAWPPAEFWERYDKGEFKE
jgi:formylglycine-generating enzyme required for sulfatase activity/serine/threonine protein kinase/Leucine-rich repeat (LRR) protein